MSINLFDLDIQSTQIIHSDIGTESDGSRCCTSMNNSCYGGSGSGSGGSHDEP
jgi:hypothetical protein